MARAAKDCGYAYARISELSRTYDPPEDLYHWRPGIFHLDGELDKFAGGFLETDTEFAICQIVGHSYDLDAENMWEQMENKYLPPRLPGRGRSVHDEY